MNIKYLKSDQSIRKKIILKSSIFFLGLNFFFNIAIFLAYVTFWSFKIKTFFHQKNGAVLWQ